MTTNNFAANIDRILLDDAVFAALSGGPALAGGYFVAAPGVYATEADDFILYDSTGGNLFYDNDGSGNNAPVWFAHLDNNPALSATDFSVV